MHSGRHNVISHGFPDYLPTGQGERFLRMAEKAWT